MFRPNARVYDESYRWKLMINIGVYICARPVVTEIRIELDVSDYSMEVLYAV